MKILILNHYAGAPSIGMEYRHFYLAREWEKLGHEILIVCASYTHLRSIQFDLKKNYEYHIVDGVKFLVIKSVKYRSNNFKRVLNILVFISRLYTYKEKIAAEFKPDVVISSSTFLFDIFSAENIARKSGAQLILEVKDLWPVSPIELGSYSKWHPYIFLMQRTENYAYRNSDKVVSLLPKADSYMISHGLSPDKFHYLPNGIDTDDWDINKEIPDEIREKISHLKSQQKKLIGYLGNHGIANALDNLIAAMKCLESDNVVLILIGQGQEKENLIKQADKLKLKNIFFLPAVPKTLVPSLLEEFDILYIGLQNQPVFRFGISPNKLIDYMMAGKPIIQAINAGNDIVKEADCGISVEPGNVQTIADAIRQLISRSEAEIKRLGNNGKSYCLKNHDYESISRKFIDIITSH
jgi:glycosyltransferase involved in cell wall biosynthesis